VEGVAGVERCLGLDEVTGEHDPVLGQPGDDVALGVASAEVLQDEVTAVAAERDDISVGEREGRPGETRDAVGLLEQPWHPAVFAGPVLHPALLDEEPGALVGDDLVGLEGARAEHAHRVVVRQHEVADRLVGVLAQLDQPVPSGRRGRPGLERRRGSPPLDRPDVRVTLGGEGVDTVGEHLEGLGLGGQVGRGGERLAHEEDFLRRGGAGRQANCVRRASAQALPPSGDGGRHAAGRGRRPAEVCRADPLVGGELRGRALGHDPATVHDHDPVGDLERSPDVLLDEQHGEALLVAQDAQRAS
jgi:hypothetical protein